MDRNKKGKLFSIKNAGRVLNSSLMAMNTFLKETSENLKIVQV